MKEESAEDEDAEGDEEEGDLLPGDFAVVLHAVMAPIRFDAEKDSVLSFYSLWLGGCVMAFET